MNIIPVYISQAFVKPYLVFSENSVTRNHRCGQLLSDSIHISICFSNTISLIFCRLCWSLICLSFSHFIGLFSHHFYPYLTWYIMSSYILSIPYSTLSDCISEALFGGKNLQSLVNPAVCLPTPPMPSHRLLSTTGKIRQPDTPMNS